MSFRISSRFFTGSSRRSENAIVATGEDICSYDVMAGGLQHWLWLSVIKLDLPHLLHRKGDRTVLQQLQLKPCRHQRHCRYKVRYDAILGVASLIQSQAVDVEETKAADVEAIDDEAVKRKSAKTYTELAQETGFPNMYVAQILKSQALLSPEAACMLRALPGLPEDLVLEMMEPPRRSYDPLLIQDPAIYRWRSTTLGNILPNSLYNNLTPFVGPKRDLMAPLGTVEQIDTPNIHRIISNESIASITPDEPVALIISIAH
ncbi:hypothetical protein RJ639_000141 [Escallonia herrerae]|uniref:Uncharacterized protein n=1 Tax=Escallonia herrerae TaxID=1293975 RepID=A0AA88X9G4_9ASTE|nr:hypothetical protein RJ639_000141 [Escallonia herrerae]